MSSDLSASKIIELKELFWDPIVMKEWQNILSQDLLENNFYLDMNNILRKEAYPQMPIAYVGGTPEKAIKGLEITNSLRQDTSSFQYIFGITRPLRRQDNLLISGSVEELIAEPDLEDWLDAAPVTTQTRNQIYAIILQLYYAAYLLANNGWDLQQALHGIKVRSVRSDATVPFFGGSLVTYGVIPVVFELEGLREIPDIAPEEAVIPYLLDLIVGSKQNIQGWDHLSNSWSQIDPTDGLAWNIILDLEIYTDTTPSLTCEGNFCLGYDMLKRSNGVTWDETSKYLHKHGQTPHLLRANARNEEDLDLDLIMASRQSLPDYLLPYTWAIFALVTAKYPDGRYQQLLPEGYPDDKYIPTFIADYTNRDLMRNLSSRLEDELNLLEDDQDKTYRRFIRSDLEMASVTNDFYLRDDFILPLLAQGNVYPLDNGDTIEAYDEARGTFTLKHNGSFFDIPYEDLFDFLDLDLGLEPYTYTVIPRSNMAIIAGRVSYNNLETGENYPLPETRLYVFNNNLTRNLLPVIRNGYRFLTLALSFLDNQEEI